MIRSIINGMCMAWADSVPGVSGGTIAFIMGFYEKFIGSIDDLFYGKGEVRKDAFIYLVKLGFGWIMGMAIAVAVITKAFENHIYFISSLFIGFIIASIPMIVNEEKETLRGRYREALFLFIGAVFVIGITNINIITGNIGIDITHLSLPLALYVFIVGMVAISAMFLPGISGSTLLLVAGLYVPVMTGIRDLMKGNMSSLLALFILAAGIVAGAFSVVKLIRYSLENFRPQTMYVILGMMAGSLYVIVMGPTTLKDNPSAPLSFSTFSIVAFLIGIVLVLAIQFLGVAKSQQK